MKAHVERSAARGYVRVPGSKSYTIRAAICAAIAAGDSLLEGALESDDTAAVFECLGSLGARVVTEGGGVRISGGELAASREPLWCRESGATLRFLAAVCATVPGVTTLRCAPSLARRPMAPLVEALRQLGVECDFDAASGTMVIRGVLQQSGHVASAERCEFSIPLGDAAVGSALRRRASDRPVIAYRLRALRGDDVRMHEPFRG